VKLRRQEPVEIAASVAIVVRDGRVLLWRRGKNEGRMAGFWELPDPAHLPGLKQSQPLGKFRHTITHHHYTFEVTRGEVGAISSEYRWVQSARLKRLPLSTVARKALRLSGDFSR
jgi:adenine-specific DNA glycosylase